MYAYCSNHGGAGSPIRPRALRFVCTYTSVYLSIIYIYYAIPASGERTTDYILYREDVAAAAMTTDDHRRRSETGRLRADVMSLVGWGMG